MKRSLVALSLLAVMLYATDASADLRKGSTMMIFNGTYVNAVNSPSDQRNSGWGGGLSWEKLASNGDWTAGLMFDYFSWDETYEGPNEENVMGEYNNILFHVKTRYFFDAGSTFKFYAGATLGFRFATYTITTDGIPYEDSESNFSMGIPVGLDVFFGDTFFLDMNYSFEFLSNSSYLEYDIVNAVNVGIGIQWGGGESESVPDEEESLPAPPATPAKAAGSDG